MEEIRKTRLYQLPADKKMLYTKNLTPGKSFFAEQLVTLKGTEYRALDPSRSKLCAAIKKGISQTGIKESDVVLYLGASHGYTSSFVSDIVGKDGFVFCIDSSPRVVRDLVFVCEERLNMAPLLFDANQPQAYKELVAGEVDVVFQDIAQKFQVQIFLKNCESYLKKGGFGVLAVKARSIDVTKRPRELFQAVRRELEESITVVDFKELDPFERDHALFVCKKK
jgi:fibrillarin-like pre-rRNA processing protein